MRRWGTTTITDMGMGTLLLAATAGQAAADEEVVQLTSASAAD